MNSFINLMAFRTCNHPHKPRGFGSPQLSICEEQCELNVNQIHHKNFIHVYGFQPETVTVIFSKEMKAEVSKLIHAHTTALFDNATDNEWRDLN